MSIHWTIAAWFLYTEVILVTLLVLPIFSATRWQMIINSRIVKYISRIANFLFIFFISVFLLDGIKSLIKKVSWGIRKYQESVETNPRVNYSSDAAAREFRAQRNLFITGVYLFLFFVIKRLVVLISAMADLELEIKITGIIKLDENSKWNQN